MDYTIIMLLPMTLNSELHHHHRRKLVKYMWELPALFLKIFYKILDVIRGEVYRRKAEVYKYQAYLGIL